MVDPEVTSLAPTRAPLVLTDPVEESHVVIVPANQLDGMTSLEGIRNIVGDAVNASLICLKVQVRGKGDIHGPVCLQLLHDAINGILDIQRTRLTEVLLIGHRWVSTAVVAESIHASTRGVGHAVISDDSLCLKMQEGKRRLSTNTATSVAQITGDHVFWGEPYVDSTIRRDAKSILQGASRRKGPARPTRLLVSHSMDARRPGLTGVEARRQAKLCGMLSTPLNLSL